MQFDAKLFCKETWNYHFVCADNWPTFNKTCFPKTSSFGLIFHYPSSHNSLFWLFLADNWLMTFCFIFLLPEWSIFQTDHISSLLCYWLVAIDSNLHYREIAWHSENIWRTFVLQYNPRHFAAIQYSSICDCSLTCNYCLIDFIGKLLII